MKKSHVVRISEETRERLLRWMDPEKGTMDSAAARALDAAEARNAAAAGKESA